MLIVSSTILTIWLTISQLGSIVRRLNITIGHFAKTSEGDYSPLIDIRSQDEVSKLMAALKSMQIKLGFGVAEAKRTSDENLRIEIALDNISTGVILTDNAGKTIADIANSVRGATSIVSEIGAASEKQTSGIEQVNLALSQMDDVTQQNAALVRQAASATESLEEQTQHLTVTVAHFKMENNEELAEA